MQGCDKDGHVWVEFVPAVRVDDNAAFDAVFLFGAHVACAPPKPVIGAIVRTSEAFNFASALYKLHSELVFTAVEFKWQCWQVCDGSGTFVEGNADVELISAEAGAAIVDILACEPVYRVAVTILAILGRVKPEDPVLALLFAEDEAAGLKQGPQVLVRHDALTLQVS